MGVPGRRYEFRIEVKGVFLNERAAFLPVLHPRYEKITPEDVLRVTRV